jgi:hypothetical protein
MSLSAWLPFFPEFDVLARQSSIYRLNRRRGAAGTPMAPRLLSRRRQP